MKIDRCPNFTGIKIAHAKVAGHKLGLYELTEKDTVFLSHLSNSIDLKKRIPNISDEIFEIYSDILKQSLHKARFKYKKSMLLICDNEPCGIIVSSKNSSKQFVDYICSWPMKNKKKAPFGAQTLFTQLYKDFLETDLKCIELYAIRFGSAISKYMHVGFASCGGDNYVEVMKISKKRVEEYYQKLKEKINLIPFSDNTDTDLLKELEDLRSNRNATN